MNITARAILTAYTIIYKAARRYSKNRAVKVANGFCDGVHVLKGIAALAEAAGCTLTVVEQTGPYRWEHSFVYKNVRFSQLSHTKHDPECC